MKMKSLKTQFIGAIAMVLVAAIAMGSSTYAWFSMNTQVKADNMMVRAVAEKGLLINEVAAYDSTTWDEEATAAQAVDTKLSKLYPASTTNGTTWYHAASKKSNNAAGATAGTKSGNLIGDYATLTGLTAITSMSSAATAGSQAKFDTMGSSATADAGYYVHYTYYLKGASGEAVTLNTTAGSMNVYIKSVEATLPDTPTSANLDKALRVGILMKESGTFYIYAPVSGYTSSYYVAAGSTATAPIAGNTPTATDLGSLPANGSAGTPVEVYLWYEGEDAACMSDNATAATLDAIKLLITFELKEVPTT